MKQAATADGVASDDNPIAGGSAPAHGAELELVRIMSGPALWPRPVLRRYSLPQARCGLELRPEAEESATADEESRRSPALWFEPCPVAFHHVSCAQRRPYYVLT